MRKLNRLNKFCFVVSLESPVRERLLLLLLQPQQHQQLPLLLNLQPQLRKKNTQKPEYRYIQLDLFDLDTNFQINNPSQHSGFQVMEEKGKGNISVTTDPDKQNKPQSFFTITIESNNVNRVTTWATRHLFTPTNTP